MLRRVASTAAQDDVGLWDLISPSRISKSVSTGVFYGLSLKLFALLNPWLDYAGNSFLLCEVNFSSLLSACFSRCFGKPLARREWI